MYKYNYKNTNVYEYMKYMEKFFSARFIYWTDNTNRSIYHCTIFLYKNTTGLKRCH